MYRRNISISDETLLRSPMVEASGDGKQPDSATENTYTNRNELRVMGMSRSGNHAIINWILSQAKGRTCFLNCAEGKTNPFTSARPLHTGLAYDANYPEFDWEQERAGLLSQKDLLVH